MYDDLLIPTDGSAGAEAVLDHAIWVATHADAIVHALFVVGNRGGAGEWDIPTEREEARGEVALETVEDRCLASDVPVEKHLRRGVPADQIIAAIDDHDIDIVVMGTHGRSGITRVVHAGSVTERVVRRADVPVLTAPLGE